MKKLWAFLKVHKGWLGIVGGFGFGTLTTLFTPFFSDAIFTSLKGRFAFSMTVKQIDYLRDAAQSMPCDATSLIAYSGLIANVVELNKVIAYNHEANRHISTDWSVPDGWDNVALIEMPCGVKHESRPSPNQ